MKLGRHTSKAAFSGLTAVFLGLLSFRAAQAQIYVSSLIDAQDNPASGTVGEYNFNGVPIDASLISGITYPATIDISGSDLFLTTATVGNVDEYTTSGGTVSSPLFTLSNGSNAIALSGGDLFVGNDNYGNPIIGEYTTSGATVNANLLNGNSGITGVITGIALSGSNLFVSSMTNHGVSTIGEYTTSGQTINSSLISGSGLSYADGLAVSGSYIFVSNFGTGTVGEYTTSGATVNASLISGITGPEDIAVSGTNMFITSAFGVVSEYSTSGTTENASLISGISDPGGIAVVSSSVTPPPPPVVNTGSVTPSTVAAGATYSPATIQPVQATGGLSTTVSIVAGSNPSNTQAQTVTLAPTNVGSQFTSLASDVFTVSGNDGTIFALQLTFDLNAANQVGGASNMTLLWLDPSDQQWINAVLGDHGTNNATAGELDFQGSFTQFQTEYGDNLSLYLGAYGVDTASDTVWAVIDHNSTFGTGNLSDLPQVDLTQSTPEPSTWALLLGGLGLLVFWRRRLRLARG